VIHLNGLEVICGGRVVFGVGYRKELGVDDEEKMA
jgi:hypothetical protein